MYTLIHTADDMEVSTLHTDSQSAIIRFTAGILPLHWNSIAHTADLLNEADHGRDASRRWSDGARRHLLTVKNSTADAMGESGA